MLWDLVWNVKQRSTEYNKIVTIEELHIPKSPTGTSDLKDPESLGMETDTMEDNVTIQNKFLDLTKHPRYPREDHHALLPAGTDKIVMHPAYEKVSARATYLNERYRGFVPGGRMGYKPPPRHLILTGVPGIGIYPAFCFSVLLTPHPIHIGHVG